MPPASSHEITPEPAADLTFRHMAEQVLLGTTLQEKLQRVPLANLTDANPGKGTNAPEAPGRPANLIMRGVGEGIARPKAHLLEHDDDRIFLLHQFANHELLAAELMALALLKFPDAPPAFRQGLLRTMQEEQLHTQLYVDRLAELGVAFGSLPVNGFFWRCVADMQTPLDYVSRLSLTFEQANLDFSQFFAARFQQAGDTATAGILDRIYHDEIRHVGYGLHWFRKWQGTEVDEWQAWTQQLAFPLSPVRAKGNVPFNAAGRRKAGLSEAFIHKLEWAQQSRGRTPWVRWFNPGAEAAAAADQATAATADPMLKALAEDLDTVSIFLAQADDVALLRNPPSLAFLTTLRDSGVALPEIACLNAQGQLPEDAPLRTRKLGRLRPWGWSADSYELLSPLLANTPAEPSAAPWSPQVRLLYSKAESLRLLDSLPWQEAFGEKQHTLGTHHSDPASAQAAVAKLWSEGTGAVVKTCFGLAGRGLAVLPANNPNRSLAAVDKLATGPEGCIVEPLLNRQADFSAHYECEAEGVFRWKGLVAQHCLPNGTWASCTAGPHFTRLLSPPVARFCQANGKSWLKHLYGELIPAALSTWAAGSGFRGMLGVDAFFYKQPNGTLSLRPIVEVNPRCTMGRLTLDLLRLASSHTRVQFQIASAKRLRRKEQPTLTLAEHFKQRQAEQPICHDKHGKIQSGLLPLNDPMAAKEFLGLATFY